MGIDLFRKSKEQMPKHVKRKVLLLGDEAVGKTSLIRKFVLDKFDDKYIATIGTKVTKKELEMTSEGEKVFLTLMIWDVLGQKGYRGVQSASFRGADGVILVCDFTRKDTLGSLEEYWLKHLNKTLRNIKMIFVANKSDLVEKSQFSLEDLKEIASKHGSVCYSSSAKTGENVEEVFLTLGKMLVGFKGEERSTGYIPSEEPPEALSIVEAADWIINDFCSGFGDMDTAMPVIRQQFSKIGVDIRNPTKDGLLKVINQLAKVELDFKDNNTVKKNKTKRRLVVERVNN